MFRNRLALVILVAFGFALFLGGLLFWGSQQVNRYFQRSAVAYATFDNYERLSQAAYRHFKQRMDKLLTSKPGHVEGEQWSKSRLDAAIEQLRTSVIAIPASNEPGERDNQRAELARVAQLTAWLDASDYRFDEIEQWHRQGKRDLAIQTLAQFSTEEIDANFQPLIDSAIHAEQAEANAAKIEMESLLSQLRGLAVLVAVLAVVCSLTAGFLLLRTIKKPIEALLHGTDEIAEGNLFHRIQVSSPTEFAYLAAHFNSMAEKLALQQEKVQKNHAMLEERVAERTYQLKLLNAELSRMDQERREFLADISHELRTPLTVIRGEAEVTLRGNDRAQAEYKEVLQRIVMLCEQLATYVNDLLFLARAHHAQLQFTWQRLDFTALVDSSVADLTIMAEQKHLLIHWQAPANAIWLHGDQQRLKQVLFILADNACRYSYPDGQITVSLTADQQFASLLFSDQGIGIPAADLEHIFERHFRSKNARTTHHGGSGLGLALAKAMITAHGGNISVTSVEQQGTQFTVQLPLIQHQEL